MILINHSDTLYCLDTSSIIEAWVRKYPRDIFPAVWSKVEDFTLAGRILLSDQILDELKRKEDGAYQWWFNLSKQYPSMIVNLETIQNVVTDVMREYPKFVNEAKGKNLADPFVIAIALKNRSSITVVTEERGGTEDKPKIPFVCRKKGICCINFLEMMQQEKWRF